MLIFYVHNFKNSMENSENKKMQLIKEEHEKSPSH